jgi:ferrous iron transport protein A
MMPLTMMKTGEEGTIKKVGGKEETKKFLETLGFVKGSSIQMVTSMNGNVIVNIKESRIAISKEMANKIMI